jgi:hypothetical protein
MPEGCVDLIYIKTRPGQLNPSFVTRSWDGKSEITVLSICSTATSRSRRAFVDASLLPNAESRFASSNSRFTRRRSRGLEGAFEIAGPV